MFGRHVAGEIAVSERSGGACKTQECWREIRLDNLSALVVGVVPSTRLVSYGYGMKTSVLAAHMAAEQHAGWMGGCNLQEQ